ncbi:hypothetical protein CEY11_10050 [Candidimonas nitroreducens]|uniref:Uncharacterized protein n=1 Tax=Candidimonas nitroreducens TaxID=683354 RepID=A0A225MGT4_9BURK|nr:hypothetical protein CEY11_10050 [Candidimonas nitroreducens]
MKLQSTRNYGFVHTSAEVLQQLRFILGQADVPEDIRRLTFRQNTSAGFFDKTFQPADFYLVEISSRKLLTIDGRPIQINYLGRYFSDFFADRARTRTYWSMAVPEKLAARKEFLKSIAVFNSLPEADQSLLERIQRRSQTDEEIERDMGEISQLIGKDRMVFVTHVNALADDGAPIAQRQALIETVSAAALKLGVPCYEPTALMREFGQDQAMEQGGLDLTHYTESFSSRLCADWFDRYIAPSVGMTAAQAVAADPVAASLPAGERIPAIEACWDSGDLREASRRVHDVLRRHPEQAEHRLLLARMQCELGDYESVIAHLESKAGTADADERPDPLLMRAYFGLGRYDEARYHANALLAEESETPEILRICAVTAEELGEGKAALENWKQLFRLGGNSAESATAALRLLLADGETEAARRWAEEVREALPSHGPSFVALWNDRVKLGDRAALRSLIESADSVDLDEREAFDLVKNASVHGLATPAAMLAIARSVPRSADPQILAWLSHQTSMWHDTGVAALNDGKLLDAADLLQASSTLAPTDVRMIRAKRSLEQRLRQEIRAAFVSKHYEKAGQISDFVQHTGLSFPGFDNYRWRVAEVLGDAPSALGILRKLADEEGASLAARIQLARVALRSSEYVEAIDAYHKILLEHPDDEMRAEAGQQLAKLTGRAIRAARQYLADGNYDRAWQLLERVEMVSPADHDVRQEKKRVLSQLYGGVRALEPESAQTRFELGQMILRLEPQDPVGLKASAVGAMRLRRFDLALTHWGALRERSENTALIDSNIRKCAMWLERENRKKATARVVPETGARALRSGQDG